MSELSSMACFSVCWASELATLSEKQVLDELAAWCRQRGASLTPIRRRVLALLRGHPGGLKAYDLLALMKQEQPNASPPTVYRALDFLIEQGLAHKIGRMNLFVACAQIAHRQPSLFLVCPHCSQVTELQHPHALLALGEALTGAGHILAHPEIEISAICPPCSGLQGISQELEPDLRLTG